MKIPVHEATSLQLGATLPFVAGPKLPTRHLLIGRERSGDDFCYDPFALYQSGYLTNPNMVVMGQVGRGKSAFVKSFLFRNFALGRRIIVIDPKGEYGALAAQIGARRVVVAPNSPTPVNPLGDVGSHATDEERAQLVHRNLAVIAALALRRALRPEEEVALALALNRLLQGRRTVTLREVVESLRVPTLDDANSLHLGPAELAEIGAATAYSFQRLLGGQFGTLFHGDSARIAPFPHRSLVLDLSAFYRSDALSLVLVALLGSLEMQLRAEGGMTLLVVDEAWAVVDDPVTCGFLRSFFKLARSFGLANLLVVHRPSDLGVRRGGLGAADASIGEGLVADCESAVIYALARPEARRAQHLFGLSSRETELLAGLGRGVALWRVGESRFLVRHELSAVEAEIIDTDHAMRRSRNEANRAGP